MEKRVFLVFFDEKWGKNAVFWVVFEAEIGVFELFCAKKCVWKRLSGYANSWLSKKKDFGM